MVKENGILLENEKQANRVVAKVMRITFLIFTLVYILDVVGIFTVDFPIMKLHISEVVYCCCCPHY